MAGSLSLREIFDFAAEIEVAADRESYLDRVCGLDVALRSEIDELLLAHEAAGGFLPDSEREIPAEAIIDVGVTKIGAYQLMGKLGEGGMGVVFRAKQTSPVKRELAIKIVKLGMDSKQVVARFAAERQALALMDHPNIARVIDVGTTDSGRPFFAMELIRGVPITDYCQAAKLDTKGKLELFLKVCEAIHHAHQKGVIHRDIRPSNVCVTVHDGRPEPKVIDFSIAKATEVELTEQTLMTHSAQMLGTLQYMSPEQFGANSRKIDVRTDVYSLGVVELLRTKFGRNKGQVSLEKTFSDFGEFIVESSTMARVEDYNPGWLDVRMDPHNDREPLILTWLTLLS